MELAHQDLVRRGFSPAAAGRIVRRAAARALRDSGMGKSAQIRSLSHPAGARVPLTGGRCVRMDVGPGNEEGILEQMNDYERRGWTVSRTSPYGDREVVYACPAGELPSENQSIMMTSESF
jgi:hypothetical protein